eukprot:CAMPEP_0201514372 /NCGR_PEP_ID=MMETSP0161_2-20130828/6231_1 /ASSEMBLY_ACC=CAM_ASM_000251 /TAXON_ID=180227 /ORGANISM="Neoparamoeba aestuarina, Strain SoJaBio B1-5/56/2" /LENGTH=135 /DNA_ID=CAMNT_0047910903 /DNA_START=46 /DNA_END=453 /DNA_ORIENTATION=+
MLGAFRRSAVLFSRYPVKTSTNITGLEVVPNAQEVLGFLYNKTLKEIQDGFPEHDHYRKSVEKTTKHRLSIIETEPDWRLCEEKIGRGQLEELIQDAEDELLLIPMMRKAKPWEVDENEKVQVVYRHLDYKERTE